MAEQNAQDFIQYKRARGVKPWRPSANGKTFQHHLNQLQYGLPPFKSQRDMTRKLGHKAREMFIEGLRTEKRHIAHQKEILAKEKTGEWKRQMAMEAQNPSEACNSHWKNADSVPRTFSTPQSVAGADSDLLWQERLEEIGLRPRASSAPPVRCFRNGTPYWKEKKSTGQKTPIVPKTPRVPNCCGSGNSAPVVTYYQYSSAESAKGPSRDQEYYFDEEEDDDLSQFVPGQHKRGYCVPPHAQGQPDLRARTSLGFAEAPPSSRRNSGVLADGAVTTPTPQRPTTPQSRPMSARPYSARRRKRFNVELTIKASLPPKEETRCPQPAETWR